MPKFIKKFLLWLYLIFHSIFSKISIALYATEQEILKANPDDLDESKKRTTRKLHHNPLLEKFYAGQRDEKYVKDYYEILKKADKFIKTATPYKMAVAAYKHGTSYGMKDQYGRRYEHYGFFDDKHKHSGKTLGEIIELELKERRTNDDELELQYIFNNKPIEVGLAKAFDTLEKTTENEVNVSEETENVINKNIEDTVEYDELKVKDILKVSKQFEFPIKIHRENDDVINKIEKLTDFLHVKIIGFEYRQFEFFIPLKFKITEVEDNSEIFNELININNIFVKNEYGELIGYTVSEYIKRIKYNDTHEVWKFRGIEMQIMS